MTNPVMIKHKYFSEIGNPFDQFQKLCLATRELPNEVKGEPEVYGELARSIMSDGISGASRKLLAFRILLELKRLGVNDYNSDHAKFLLTLRQGKFWMEFAFDKRSSLKERDCTIFVPHEFQFSGEFSQKIEAARKSRGVQQSRRMLSRSFRRIRDAVLLVSVDKGEVASSENGISPPSREKSVFRALLQPQRTFLLDAIAKAHFEIFDNTICHALPTNENIEFMRSEDREPFGDFQYLKFSTTSFLRSRAQNREPWPSEIYRYMENFPDTKLAREKRMTNGGRFLMISYADNGPGIVEHLRKFGPGATDDVTSACPVELSGLEEVVENHMTSRPLPGAGLGLTRIREVIAGVGGCIYVHSGAYRNCYSYPRGLEVDELCDHSTSGTLIAIIIPVFP